MNWPNFKEKQTEYFIECCSFCSFYTLTWSKDFNSSGTSCFETMHLQPWSSSSLICVQRHDNIAVLYSPMFKNEGAPTLVFLNLIYCSMDSLHDIMQVGVEVHKSSANLFCDGVRSWELHGLFEGNARWVLLVPITSHLKGQAVSVWIAVDVLWL